MFLLIVVLCSYVLFNHDSFVVILVCCDLGVFHVHCDLVFLLIVMVLCSFYLPWFCVLLAHCVVVV